MNESGLDEKRIKELREQMLMLIRQNYIKGPLCRDRVYEALNVLAFCAAAVIRGTNPDEALQWFSDALNIYLGK